MGRAILIVVLLVSTIYAGIVVQVQKEMYKLPEVITDNFVRKDLENVSDYALRAAVRLGTERPEFRMQTGETVKTLSFDGSNAVNSFPIYRHYPRGTGDNYYEIRKIIYTRTAKPGPDLYEAEVTILKPSQTFFDTPETYVAQIGYEYFNPNIDGPLVIYGDYGSQVHIPTVIDDQSLQNPPTRGYVFGIGDEHTQFVKLDSKGVWGTGSGHKCFEFGHSSSTNWDNGNNHMGAGIQSPNPTNAADYQTLLNRLKQYNQFTVSVYAKIEQLNNNSVNQGQGQNGTGGNIVTNRGNSGTMIWFATNPTNSRHNEPGYTRPAIAIWYDDYRLSNPNRNTVTVRYGITIDDGTPDGTYHEIARPGVPTETNTNNSPYQMYTLTFNNGVLTAYYNGNVVGTRSNMGGTRIKPNDFGFTIGVRDIRADPMRVNNPIYIHGRLNGVHEFKDTNTNYMFFNGLIDYYTFWDVALTPAQIVDWYNMTIGKTSKQYIRD